jgi:hypothetical protein
MAVFLLKNPDAVFIHIPKTAGRSIRVGAWDGRYEGPARGYIPDDWEAHFKFAFVRDPLKRLVSAWRMFSDGRVDVPRKDRKGLLSLLRINRTVSESHRPLFPGLTIAEFMDMAEDETIGLDDRTPGKTKRRSVLRTHAVPQTHPHNLIDRADYIGRFERIDAEMVTIGERLGARLVLPHTNKTTQQADWRSQLTPALYDRIVEYYRADFERFGYPIKRFDELG